MRETISKTLLGVAGPAAGIVASLTTLESWLRILSLCVGIAVGLASLTSIVRKK